MTIETKRLISTFISQLKNTEEYKAYEEKREQIKKFPSRLQKANEYRMARFALSQCGGDDIYDRLQDFERENEAVHLDEIIEEYLVAEMDMCRMLREAYVQIYAAIDIDIDTDVDTGNGSF